MAISMKFQAQFMFVANQIPTKLQYRNCNYHSYINEMEKKLYRIFNIPNVWMELKLCITEQLIKKP